MNLIIKIRHSYIKINKMIHKSKINSMNIIHRHIIYPTHIMDPFLRNLIFKDIDGNRRETVKKSKCYFSLNLSFRFSVINFEILSTQIL